MRGNLILRADAGGLLGSGHVMRLFALGQAWVVAGGRAILASSALPDALRARILAEPGFAVRDLPAPAGGPEDARAVAALPDGAIMIDGYVFKPAYLRMLSESGRKVALVDDVGALDTYPCALVVNPNLHATPALYAGKGDAEFLLGPYYAMLRPEFDEVRIAPPLRGPRALATFGGVDPKGLSLLALDAFRIAQTPFDLIVGAANPRAEEIRARAATLPHIQVHADVRDMAMRMARARFILSAAGTTVWEAASLAAPMALIAVISEESATATRLAAAGGCRYLGPAESVSAAELAAVLLDLDKDDAQRRRLGDIASRLVDGRGAARVAAAVARLGA